MSSPHDLERRLADFYADEAPTRAPDWVLGSALKTIETTEQRRVNRAPRRFPNMNSFAKVVVAAMVVIASAAVGLAVLRPVTGPDVGGPTVSSTPSPSSTPASSDPPRLDAVFTSPRYGYSIGYPEAWMTTPGSEPWSTGLPSNGETGDYIAQQWSDSPFVGVSSQPLAGRLGEQWAADLSMHVEWGDSCPTRTESVQIDGWSSPLVIHCPEAVQSAFVWHGGRGYIIVGYRLSDVDWFREVLATVRLSPEDAIDAPPSASPPGG